MPPVPPSGAVSRNRSILIQAAQQYLLETVSKEKITPATIPPASLSSTSVLIEAILHIMREQAHADIALLEKRELYTLLSIDDRDGPTNPPLQKILDRMLWEGSTLQKVTISGATLKAVLQRSKSYSEAESSSTVRVHTRGLPLLSAGVIPGKSKGEYVVNGLLLDDNRPYSIAIAERPVTTAAD